MEQNKLLFLSIAIIFVLLSPSKSQAQCPPGDSLLCYFSFTGNANDESGNNNHGSVVNATLTTDRFGIQNGAYFFDGNGDFITANNLDYQGSYEASISVWVKPYSITNKFYYNITRQGPSPANLLLAFQGGNLLSFGINTSFGYRELDVPIDASDYEDGNWHCITAVYDGSDMKLYTDGVLIGSRWKTGSIVGPKGKFSVGSMNRTREFYHGAIDEIRFYNRALDSAEVLNLCNKIFPTPLNLGLDTIVCSDSLLKVMNAYYPNSTYLWQDSSTASEFTATQPGVYWVEVTDSCGTFGDSLVIQKVDCDTIIIPPPPPPPPPSPHNPSDFNPARLILPNVFSPNGDGYNDIFRCLVSENISSMNTEIYNRWGTKVFSTTNLLIEWDGRSTNGEILSEGVYYWLISYVDNFGDQHSQNGNLTLFK